MVESDGDQIKQTTGQSPAPPLYDPLAPDPSQEPPSRPAPAAPGTPSSAAASPQTPEDESTVGTGTSLALGCIAATLLLIVLGLILLGISALT